MPRKSGTAHPRSDATRAALLAAATEVFARIGFEAVGTRDIAAAAGVNSALIGYHFGSKEGLYLAVFRHITESMEQRIGPALAGIDSVLSVPGQPEAVTAERSRMLLGRLCDAMLATLAQESSGPWGPLLMREQQSPTAAFDIVYEGFMKRMLGAMTRLVMAADPSRPEQDARLAVVGLMGQMMVFRVARAGVMRHLGWKRMGPRELAQAQAMLGDSVRRLLVPGPPPPTGEASGRPR